MSIQLLPGHGPADPFPLVHLRSCSVVTLHCRQMQLSHHIGRGVSTPGERQRFPHIDTAITSK
jgi:hypothetical protein